MYIRVSNLLVVTTKSVVQLNTYLFDSRTGAVNAGKSRNAEANVIGNGVRIPSTVLFHGRTPVTSYFLHAPSHLLQIKRMTRNPAHELIFRLIMRTHAIDIGDLRPLWLAT